MGHPELYLIHPLSRVVVESVDTIATVWVTQRQETLTYDKIGNRLTDSIDGGDTQAWDWYPNNNGGHSARLKFDGTWHYFYDDNGNTTIKAKALLANGSIDTTQDNWNYSYDQLNQLIGANEKGWFQKKPEDLNPDYGIAERDLDGTQVLSFNVASTDTVSLDVGARSVGLDLKDAYGITKIELHALNSAHRVKERDLAVWASQNNNGDEVRVTGWNFSQAADGTITLEFAKAFEARYLKINTLWDDRDLDNNTVTSAATFRNTARTLVQVWALAKSHNEAYEYDKTGNRDQLTSDGLTSSYQYYQNAQGGNLTWLKTDGKWFYQYDLNGNTVTKAKALLGTSNTSPVDTAQEYWSYHWDLNNRLTSVSQNGTVIASYTYDVDNLRVTRAKGSNTTVFAYGRNGALTYHKNLTTNDSRTFTYLNNQVVGWTDVKGGISTKYYATTDQLGSVTQVTDAAAQVVWASEYNPFGKTAGVDGTYEFDGSYAGHEVDVDTGLIYMWNRWQDPETGRFLSEDPARDGGNWYAYVGNNPIGHVDPTGLIFGIPSDGQTTRSNPAISMGQQGIWNKSAGTMGTTGCLVVAVARIINEINRDSGLPQVSAADLVTGKGFFGPPSFVDQKDGVFSDASIQKAIKTYTGQDYAVSNKTAELGKVLENTEVDEATAFVIGRTSDLAGGAIDRKTPHQVNLLGAAKPDGTVPYSGTSIFDDFFHRTFGPDLVRQNNQSQLDQLKVIVKRSESLDYNRRVGDAIVASIIKPTATSESNHDAYY